MRVFLSWSGERSQALGRALKDWLPIVLQYAEPWISNRDIAAGERWTVEVGKELERSNFGVLCLTRENLDAPWLVFEAGALSKVVATSAVCPYLLDVEVSEISGPLSQFQAKKSDKAGTLDLLQAINGKATTPLDESRLTQAFENMWPAFETALAGIPKSPQEGKPSRPQAEVLEDLVTSVRALESAFQSFKQRIPHVGFPSAAQRGRLVGLQDIPHKNLIIVADDSFPNLAKGRIVAMEFWGGDLVPVVAKVAGVDPESYGSEWHLRFSSSVAERILTREECLDGLALFDGLTMQVVITTVPF